MSEKPTIGIVAVQGGVAEHAAALARLGVEVKLIRRPEHLAGVDALVFPGGESTTMSKLLVAGGLFDAIKARIDDGMPAWGTCAGMILLATTVLDTRDDAVSFGALDIKVRRNAFGRQTDSFEAMLEFVGIDHPIEAVFIRAPWVESVGDGVEVLSTVKTPSGRTAIVAVRQGNVLATSFHPEVTVDTSVARYFLTTCVG